MRGRFLIRFCMLKRPCVVLVFPYRLISRLSVVKYPRTDEWWIHCCTRSFTSPVVNCIWSCKSTCLIHLFLQPSMNDAMKKGSLEDSYRMVQFLRLVAWYVALLTYITFSQMILLHFDHLYVGFKRECDLIAYLKWNGFSLQSESFHLIYKISIVIVFVSF